MFIHVLVLFSAVAWQQKGQGCPSREPVVSEDEQKQMMAYYYRKQEEFKVWTFLLWHTYRSLQRIVYVHCLYQ